MTQNLLDCMKSRWDQRCLTITFINHWLYSVNTAECLQKKKKTEKCSIWPSQSLEWAKHWMKCCGETFIVMYLEMKKMLKWILSVSHRLLLGVLSYDAIMMILSQTALVSVHGTEHQYLNWKYQWSVYLLTRSFSTWTSRIRTSEMSLNFTSNWRHKSAATCFRLTGQ